MAKAHGPRRLEVTPGGGLELCEVRVGGQLAGRTGGLVQHGEGNGVAEPRGQRFDLFAELGGESHPAEVDGGDFHEAEQDGHFPEVSFGPQ